jgi:hypothetical protein
MARTRKTSFLWIGAMALLGAGAIGAIVRVRSDRRDAPAPAVGTSASKGLRCVSIFPDTFTIAPGGRQEMMARFAGGSGHRHFHWSATGGTLVTSTGRGGTPTLEGDFYGDDFDDGVLDAALWQKELAKDGSLLEKQGVLLAFLGQGNEDRAARLESSAVLQGDFAAQVTIRDVSAKGNRGTASLSFVTLDGHTTHIQAIGGLGYAALEANTREVDGTWRTSASAFYGGGPVTLRMVRIGSTFSCSFDRGSGHVPLGSFAEVSAGEGRLRLETWSLEEHPAVESELDNFGAGQNTIVVWQAPPDARAGSSYTITLGGGCEAKAIIGKPAAAP